MVWPKAHDRACCRWPAFLATPGVRLESCGTHCAEHESHVQVYRRFPCFRSPLLLASWVWKVGLVGKADLNVPCIAGDGGVGETDLA